MINQNKQAIELESMACYTNKINNNLNLTSNNFTKKITKNPAHKEKHITELMYQVMCNSLINGRLYEKS